MVVFSDGMLLRKMSREPAQYIGVSHGYSESATSISLAPHIGTSAGDFLVAILYKSNLNAFASAVAGWTRVLHDVVNFPGMAVYTRIAGASEPSTSFSHTGAAVAMRGSMITVRNVSQINLATVVRLIGSAISTTSSLNAVGGGILFASYSRSSPATASSASSGMTDIGNSESSPPPHALFRDNDPTAPGSTGSRSASWSSSVGNAVSVLFEVHP